MPIDPSIVGAGLGIASSALGNFQNNAANQANNLSQMQYNIQMYDKQRKDAIADWNMQNAYNSPMAQMARLKAAGLNPNLVYGHGADAGEAAPVRQSDTKAYNPSPNRYDYGAIGSAVAQMYDIRLKQAQIDNTQSLTDVNKAREQEIQAHIPNLNQDTQLKDAKTDGQRTANALAKATFDSNVQRAAATVNKITADIAYVNDENARRNAKNAQDIKESIERTALYALQQQKIPVDIAKLREQIDLMDKDGQLRQLQINLQKLGVDWRDPAYLRIPIALGTAAANSYQFDADKAGNTKTRSVGYGLTGMRVFGNLNKLH